MVDQIGEWKLKKSRAYFSLLLSKTIADMGSLVHLFLHLTSELELAVIFFGVIRLCPIIIIRYKMNESD
jgi:hypothetical protein